jgi:glycine/D-amino acid oxidase-like deaminating enzyme/nitrite reductase/ring-hydroxylating ferredoxin subunit
MSKANRSSNGAASASPHSLWQPFTDDDSSARADLAQAGRRGVWDVCVVGAGVAGLLTALELLERGMSVVVLERDRLGSGETGKTTAHLTSVLDTRYYELRRMHGDSATRLLIQSQQRAIAHIERVANFRRIACDFERVSGFLLATRDEHREILEKEHHFASEAGLACHLLRTAPLPFAVGPALHVGDQAKIDPRKFMLGVARAVRALGGLIGSPAQVQQVEPGSPNRVVTSRGQAIQARKVVVATDTPINDKFKMHTKQAAYRSYALALTLHEAPPRDLFWDMEDPYHYVRTHRFSTANDDAAEVLIVGGEDHKVGQEADPEACWDRLETWTRERFPAVDAVVNRWSGQILEPVDGVAYIGGNPGDTNVYVATGFSGNGMTYGAISALLIADLIAGVDNPWTEIYQPSRKPASLSAVASYVGESVNVAAQYLDWVRPGANTETLAAGEGIILRRGLKKLAVYCDHSGRLHEFSATCPHLGGVVAWNRAEKTWDCPCHGSRFDSYGKVLNGPAVSDLKPAEDDNDRESDSELAGVVLPSA